MSGDNLSWCQKSSETCSTNFNLLSNTEAQKILKCFFCEKFLSVPPIFSHDVETICGRCKFVDKVDGVSWTRQVVYEALAQYMIFPCSNVSYGCKAQLRWGEVEEHENTCLYKKINCPFFNDDLFDVKTGKCRWIGSGPGLNEHLESCHSDLIKKLPEINFTETKSHQIFLTKILKQLMIITIKYQEPGKYSCLVMVNGTSADCDAYRYQLELFDENRKNSLILRRSRLEDAVGFEENFVNPDKMLIVQYSVVEDLLKNARPIIGRFGIIKKSKKELSFGDRAMYQQESPLDEQFLRELECPICKCYMIPPIHQCQAGHSFCLKCKQQMEDCPTCRSPFYDTRNYTLEKLVSNINYPCMYKDAGCYVTCPWDKLHEHEQDCSFSSTQCFLNCSPGAVLNMFKHLNEKHQDCLITLGELHLLDVGEGGDGSLKYFSMCFGNDIFRLVVRYDEGWIKFALHQYGVKRNNYIYELEIICSTECTERLCITKECPPLSSNILKKCISIPEDMIEKFISEEDIIFFKINLKKSV